MFRLVCASPSNRRIWASTVIVPFLWGRNWRLSLCTHFKLVLLFTQLIFFQANLLLLKKKKNFQIAKKITPLWTITGQTLVACSECLALSPGISRVCYPELYDHIHTCPEPKQTHSAPETCTDVNEFVHPVCYVDAHWELSAFEGSPREVYSHQPAKIFVDCNFSPSCAPLYCKWTAEQLLCAREVADKNLILNHKGPGH